MSAIVETTYVGTARDTSASLGAVSWGAIFAGAAAAAALSLILLLLGMGLGLSSVSPWAAEGIDGSTFGVSSILWVTFMQLAASAMGGYLAGRLRTKWADVHTDEVYFRDTAHGFLAWAVATIATAALLTSAVGSIIGGGIQAGAAVAGSAVSATVDSTAVVGSEVGDEVGDSTDEGGPMSYFVDTLFRPDTQAGPSAVAAPDGPAADGANLGANSGAGAPPARTTAPVAEVTRIFANGIRAGAIPDEDIQYIGRVVAERTGLTPRQAEQRVRDVFANVQMAFSEAETAAREAADAAREASAYAALWLFISLLIGAFIASWMATFGGRQRDL
jgi:hypothetical protein